ncbi:MAG: hypothetical protein CTY16_12045 [Methylobacter sp.]|nr:MAG: hypothetical protein CTY16_12045 [Methylobacter sp.]
MSRANKLKPDFTHRLEVSEKNAGFTLGDLTDTVGLMAERAAAIVNMVSIQLESETRSSDAILASALDAAYLEIKDINALVVAFSQSPQAQKSPQN